MLCELQLVIAMNGLRAGHESGREITASLGNVTVRGEKRWKGQGRSTAAKSLIIYSITENIYYSQLSSVALLLQPERNCFTSYNNRKELGSLSLCAIVLRSSPPSHVSTCNGQRSSQLFCVQYMQSLKGTRSGLVEGTIGCITAFAS
jgi:hypothetical protein